LRTMRCVWFTLCCQEGRRACIVHTTQQETRNSKRRQHGNQLLYRRHPSKLETSRRSLLVKRSDPSYHRNRTAKCCHEPLARTHFVLQENTLFKKRSCRSREVRMSAAVGSSSGGGGGMPGGLSAKQQKLFELRMRMVRAPSLLCGAQKCSWVCTSLGWQVLSYGCRLGRMMWCNGAARRCQDFCAKDMCRQYGVHVQ